MATVSRLTNIMLMDTSDETLVKLASSGDADAFSQLLARHYDLVFRLAFRMLGRRSEAEDLAQDICADLPAKLRNFRGQAKFTTWLYRVTVNAATDRRRASATRASASDTWGELELMNRATANEQAAALSWLQDAMTMLSPELRDTVALVLGEDMTHARAATVLEVSEGTVSWRMSEVRKTLRAMAKDEERVG